MKELILLLLALLGMLLPKNAQAFCVKGEGGIVTKELNVSSFEKISIECSADVQLRYGATQSVEAQGQSNVIDLLTLEVVNGKWKIDFSKSVCYNKEFTLFVTLPSIEEVRINGSGDVKGMTAFNQESFKIEINGSGDVDMAVNANDVELEVDGSGDILLSGKSKSLDVEIDGSGDISAYDLMVENCSVDVNGSGDSKVYVDGYLHANINGSGDIYYKGNTNKVDISENGSGDVYRR